MLVDVPSKKIAEAIYCELFNTTDDSIIFKLTNAVIFKDTEEWGPNMYDKQMEIINQIEDAIDYMP